MFRKKDIQVEYFRASGPGGQRRNKKDTAVRVTHLPTGIRAVGTESRYRSRNLRAALMRLGEKLDLRSRKTRPRLPTRTPRRAEERRLLGKRLIGEKKSMRGKVTAHED
ncbi:MAG: peptide chain release factor-like protein [Deltaproteobacteria bacterium]|uniref:Peptide chain release factor-like protein n=1 Tax=Candidatus Zymogenus saltonus TaxID=2844893 RepID=A0A9D8KFY5_9DELT|nr:peptide chain release factor-like protein [Candidatus Zymogenus saltonus]